jgi:hypothetical protein
MKLRSTTTAAILYVLSGVAVLGVWYITLFMVNPPRITATGTFEYLVFTGPSTAWFRWFLVLPVLCFSLAAAYGSRIVESRFGARTLFALGLCLTLAAWATVTFAVALTLSLAVAFGFQSLKVAPANPGESRE